MTYPEFFVAPMRQELTDLGVRELRSAAEVDAVLGRQLGQPGDQQGPTVMVVVNSVCGCAAGKALCQAAVWTAFTGKLPSDTSLVAPK